MSILLDGAQKVGTKAVCHPTRLVATERDGYNCNACHFSSSASSEVVLSGFKVERSVTMRIGLSGFPASHRWSGYLSAIAIAFFAAPVLAEDTTDVTSAVVAAVRDNKLSIDASNATFGDTAPGVPKKLHVDYRSLHRL